MMVLTNYRKYTQDRKILNNAIDISLDWAKRCKIENGNNKTKGLFGIVQEGLYKDLRLKCLEKLILMILMVCNGWTSCQRVPKENVQDT